MKTHESKLLTSSPNEVNIAIAREGGKVRAVYVSEGALSTLLNRLDLPGDVPAALLAERGCQIVEAQDPV